MSETWLAVFGMGSKASILMSSFMYQLGLDGWAFAPSVRMFGLGI